jgi:Na+/melibiose symporter-like transporter
VLFRILNESPSTALDAHQTRRPESRYTAATMQMLYYTLAGIVLYLVADWILNRIEIRRGARFDNRTLIFFAILLALALISFQLIQYFFAPTAS